MGATPKLTPAQIAAAKALKDSKFAIPVVPQTTTSHPNVNTTKSSSLIKKIDSASAMQLLTDAAKTAGYTGTISQAEVQDFITKFNTQSTAQAKTVASTVQARLKVGATADDIAQATANAMSTEFPDYFNARGFAKDYIWTKWSAPGTSKAFGGQALDALNQVRQLAQGWGGVAISDAEINAYAKEVVMKTKSIGDVNAEIAAKGSINYPQFSDQIKRVLATDPTATMYNIAQPYINQMEQTLELPSGSVKLDNPLLDKALRPDGSAGKLPAQSLADFNRSLMNTPQWEQTTAANNFGRDSATGLAHAMGMGL